MKICKVCGLEKPFDQYQRKARAKDGLRPECKPCVSAESRRYYEVHREKIKEKTSAHYHANRENMLPKRREWYLKNKPVVIARATEWKRENPDSALCCTRNRRARIKGSTGKHTKAEVMELLQRQHHRCANPYCGADLKVERRHLDHIVPVARGGSNGIENLQWLCAPCNYRKKDLDPKDWLERESRSAGESVCQV